ncbi:hypothetical protein P3T76_008275 [Phytophthora citrophthora]|uniref:M96 mating-specific protein family n=1 Tax=Phytophthora citrophthora TaxID=4793 RepID=A0AAD9LLF7_9STRA|nr:hypothetical protein P3T76_008275 [Phytophthora citrophthora]
MELEEVLALLDAAPDASTSPPFTALSSSIGPWEPDIHWGIADDDTDDFTSVSTDNSTVSVQNPKPSTKKKQKRKPGFNPNKARDERRVQLIELNEQVAELEFTLNQLQAIRNQRPKGFGDKTHTPRQDKVPPVWQEICNGQLTQRLQAERDNIRLKQQYERDRQLFVNLKKILYPRQTRKEAKAGAKKHTRRTDIPAGYIERMAALIFKELEARVKICYEKVDSFFESNRAAPITSAIPNSFLDSGKGTEKRFYDKRVIPFEMHMTAAAWWENWQSYRGQGLGDTEANEIVERFGLEMSDFKTNTSATAYGQQITQRHVEEGRVVFVFDAYLEAFGYQNEQIDGVYFLEQTYVLVQPNTPEIGGVSTCISTCYVITPHFLDPKLEQDSKAAEIVDFLVSSMSSKMTGLSEMVENVLLDRALQSVSLV